MTAKRKDRLGLLLREYRPVDESEAGHRRRMGKLLAAGADPFDRYRFDPGHFTASAFVLSPDGSSLLLLYHDKLERWLQPGGHVEPGDPDLLASARREGAEETGLCELDTLGDGIFDLDVHPIPARSSEPEHLHHDVRFLFRSRSMSVRAGPGVRSPRWVPFDEVAMRSPGESMLRILDKLRHH